MKETGKHVIKKKNKAVKVAILLVIGLLLTGFIFLFIKVKGLQGEKLGDTNINDGIKDNIIEKGVVNIALFGVDSRTEEYDGTRSDSNLVVSIDFTNKKVTITSVARDCYVYIPEYGYDKFNHAYATGGPQLAVEALNTNFDMDIEDYVTLNFWAVEKIIDHIDGIEVIIQDYEVDEVNKFIDELNRLSNDNTVTSYVTEGTQLLSGRQAVSYMRIRKVGDYDYERMERQRRVLSTALKKVGQQDIGSLLSLLNKCASYIETSLDITEMGQIGGSFAEGSLKSIDQMQIPQREELIDATIFGTSYILPNTLESNIRAWYRKVYGIEHTLSSQAAELNEYFIYQFTP